MGNRKIFQIEPIQTLDSITDGKVLTQDFKNTFKTQGEVVLPKNEDITVAVKKGKVYIKYSADGKVNRYLVKKDCNIAIVYRQIKARKKSVLIGMTHSEKENIGDITEKLRSAGLVGKELKKAKRDAVVELRSRFNKNKSRIIKKVIDAKARELGYVFDKPRKYKAKETKTETSDNKDKGKK